MQLVIEGCGSDSGTKESALAEKTPVVATRKKAIPSENNFVLIR
jgi:hypothetical protein